MEEIKPEKTNKYLIIAFGLATAFFAGFYLKDPLTAMAISRQTADPAAKLEFSYLNDVLQQLEGSFIEPEKIDQNKLVYGAAKGMVESLGDPYTSFFDPGETKSFQDDISGYFEGTGMQIEVRNERLKVVAPLEDTPAQRAGILAGDEILKINSTSTVGMSSDEAVSLIKGPKGTKIVLNIYRNGWEEAKDFEMVRDTIRVPSLDLSFKEVNGKKVACLKIFQFSDILYGDFQKAAREIISENAQGVILDLRNNPGGLLDQAQDIAGWFLKNREVILKEETRVGDKYETKDYLSFGPSTFASKPVVILINQGSASASEILAAALHDNRNAVIIGETSFGKGKVQQLFGLADNSSVKITIANWLTPKGEQIDGNGIKPDVEVKMTADDYDNGKDPQLDKAVEIISSKI
jgi:carboxyl-terminal processing protease